MATYSGAVDGTLSLYTANPVHTFSATMDVDVSALATSSLLRPSLISGTNDLDLGVGLASGGPTSLTVVVGTDATPSLSVNLLFRRFPMPYSIAPQNSASSTYSVTS